MTTKKTQEEVKRFYKFVGGVGFSRLPRGPIDPAAYADLPPDLRHIVLHSGAWKPMTENEIEKYEADLAKANEEPTEAEVKI